MPSYKFRKDFAPDEDKFIRSLHRVLDETTDVSPELKLAALCVAAGHLSFGIDPDKNPLSVSQEMVQTVFDNVMLGRRRAALDGGI